MREEMGTEDKEELDKMMATLFTIFYVDDAYIVSRDPSSYNGQSTVSSEHSNVLVLRLTPRKCRR